MLERRKKSEDERGNLEFDLFIDGVLLEGVDITGFKYGVDQEVALSTLTLTQAATDRLLEYPLVELIQVLGRNFRLFYEVNWNEAVGHLWPMGIEEVQVHLVLNKISHWRHAYSFDQYYQALIQESAKSPSRTMSVENMQADEDRVAKLMPFDIFIVTLKEIHQDLPLKLEIEPGLIDFRSLHDKVVSELEAKYPTHTVEVSFDFPEEVRVPCEQYLLYFVQFLKDLGVDATAELRHVAGEVLFAVTPADKDTALDNIRTALETYLQLPSSPVANDAMAEVAIQRLAANVEHLRGQVRLANAEIQLKNATIQAQQATIELLRGDVILESVTDVTPRPKGEGDKEYLLGKSVALTPFNWKGVEINLAEIFRKLRALLRRDQN